MTDPQGIKIVIQSIIQNLMDGVMRRVLIEDPFIKEKHRADKPLYAALVPDEIFKGSHFERRFVTPFGGVWEKLAVEAAKISMGYAQLGYRIDGTVKSGRLERINEVLRRLEHAERGQKKQKPDWDTELAYVLAAEGESLPVAVVCDVYCENVRNKERYAFELKAPLPNSDQSKVSKEKLLKLHAMEPKQVDGAYFALPYNPYGKREDYAWSFPGRWFDMRQDAVVLIGDEFWDKIGGAGTYSAFVSAINEIAVEYKERIYREYLGIEPPPDAFESQL
jgi:hypothetical protein